MGQHRCLAIQPGKVCPRDGLGLSEIIMMGDADPRGGIAPIIGAGSAQPIPTPHGMALLWTITLRHIEFVGDLVNGGATIAPGASAGTMSLTGALTINAGGLEIELESDPVLDMLDVTGAVALGGALDVLLLGGYTPADGAQFSIMTAGGGITGGFASVTPGYAADIVGGTELVLTVIALPGDFDGSHTYSAADIDLLTSEIASGSPDLSYDLTGDGQVTGADLDELVGVLIGTEYGDADLDFVIDGGDLALMGAKWLWTAPAGAVPGPATLSLLAVGGMALVRRRRK